MTKYENYILELKESDLTFISPSQNVKSLVGSVLENKQSNFIKSQERFIKNIKVLNSLVNKPDERSKSIFKKVFNISKGILKDIAKIEKSAIIENQVLRYTEEYEDYFSNNTKTIDFLLEGLEQDYKCGISEVSLPQLKAILHRTVKSKGKDAILSVISEFIAEITD